MSHAPFNSVKLWLIVILSISLNVNYGLAKESKTFPSCLDGSMMIYDFSHSENILNIPDSLHPVYISYIARHGARFLSSANKIATLENRLYSLAMQKKLTPEGERFFQLISSIKKATANRWGALSPVGTEEETKLAREMCALFPSLMGSGRIKAEATYVPRVVMTMYDFCHTLAGHSSNLSISTAEGRQFDPLLRFFETDSIYADYRKSGEWEKICDEYELAHVSPDPALRILGQDSGLTRHELIKTSMDIYSILQGLRAAGLPGPSSEWMTQDEYENCWKADNLEHYLRNTLNSVSDAAIAASSLLKEIISEADINLSGSNSVNASLFFGHAETLMPLFSLMRLPGCYYDCKDLDFQTVADHWRDYEIVPLGANLLLVFLKSDSGNIYMASRLNGRFIEPLPGYGIFVDWSRMKARWLDEAGGKKTFNNRPL